MNYYEHDFSIEIPRALCDHMGQKFPLQEIWKQRMKALCSLFISSVGCIKMDAMSYNNSQGILNHRSANMPDVISRHLTGYAWLTCVSQRQLEAMGGAEAVRAWNVFHEIQETDRGGALLQLTPDMEIIKREENARMVRKLRPFLRFERFLFDDIPPSFRMELDPQDISIIENDFGQYVFTVEMPY